MKKILFICVLCLSLQSVSVPAVDEGPTAQLKPVMADLVSVLSDQSLMGPLHLTERRAKIMKYIKEIFDFREMSKRVLGRTWRKLNGEERDNFTRLMTKLLENVYIGKLEGYSGQKIVFAAERIKGKRAQVTTLIKGNRGPIPIHYIMRRKGTSWLVYDINIEGVSLVRNYQEQFKEILRRQKYAGLVEVLKAKNRSFEQHPVDNPVNKEDK